MAFKIADDPTFKRTVPVYVPSDAGFDTSQTLDVTFRALKLSEQGKYDPTTLDGSAGLLDAVLANVEGVVEGGDPVPWGPALRDMLYDRAYVRASLIKGFFEGLAIARSGN